MTTATEFLDAFNNAFVNKDRSYLDLILADNCKIHFTGLNETMTRQETLDWSETGICSGIDDYVIVNDTDESIAGTHAAWGKAEDGDWKSRCFIFAKKSGDKITEWYVDARPMDEGKSVEIIVATPVKRIWDTFGLHFGQYSR